MTSLWPSLVVDSFFTIWSNTVLVPSVRIKQTNPWHFHRKYVIFLNYQIATEIGMVLLYCWCTICKENMLVPDHRYTKPTCTDLLKPVMWLQFSGRKKCVEPTTCYLLENMLSPICQWQRFNLAKSYECTEKNRIILNCFVIVVNSINSTKHDSKPNAKELLDSNVHNKWILFTVLINVSESSRVSVGLTWNVIINFSYL